jgi:SpoVK/Ycf46/Vps4 family AAA+-type ATPase
VGVASAAKVAAATANFSPADLECLCRRARLNAAVRTAPLVDAVGGGGGAPSDVDVQPAVVTTVDLQLALRDVTATVTVEELEVLAAWRPRRPGA